MWLSFNNRLCCEMYCVKFPRQAYAEPLTLGGVVKYIYSARLLSNKLQQLLAFYEV